MYSEDYEKYFYERLSKLRSQKNVSARDMSLSIGQSENYINSIENKRMLPSMMGFFYICEYFGIHPKEFFDEQLENPGISKELMEKVSRLKKSGLTFAPEAGTQRLRDVINKNVTEEELMNTCRTAFEGGYTSVKLYFMMGLPTETMEDIEGIANLAQKVVDLYYSLPTRPKGRAVSVSISCACFVPKPFTPFEFEAQDSMELLREKQKHLLASVKSKKISVSYHDADVSFIEAVLAKGDRRLGGVIEAVWKKGSRLDGWYEYFDPQRWYDAMAELQIDPAFYANRRREYDEVMPWDHLDFCVSKTS